jgi:hypothetical protein
MVLVLVCCVCGSLLFTAGTVTLVSQSARFSTLTPTIDSQSIPLPTSEFSEDLPPAIARQMDSIQKQVIQIRGLFPDRAVRRGVLSPVQLRKQVTDDFSKENTPAKIKDSVAELSQLGLLEPGFDLYNLYININSEQIAGYFDPKTAEMFVVQGQMFGGLERMNYSHEYTHALQDQNYDIQDGLKINDAYCEKNGEYCSAVRGLIEGDATLVQQNWLLKDATSQDQSDIQNFYASFKSPVFEAAPLYLQKDFLFPYKQGFEFVQALYSKGGFPAVDSAYENLPVSTEQILHPDKYPNDKPALISLPDFLTVLGADWREIDRNMLGEWSTFLVLAYGQNSNFRLPEAQARLAAAGWGGDSLVAYIQDSTRRSVLVLRSRWDTSIDSDEFWSALQTYGSKRWGQPAIKQVQWNQWEETPNGTVVMARSGLDTLWLMAPDFDTLTALLSKIPDFKKE